MASTAYGTNPASCVAKFFPDSQFIRQVTVPCDIISDYCSGFTAVSHTDGAIILAFAGSQTTQQIFMQGGYTIFYPKVIFAGGNVNYYFWNGMNSIWTNGMEDDFTNLIQTYPSYEVWVTGHSLGAAEASLAAALISSLNYTTPDKIKLITFGQPRTGDLGYSNNYPILVPYAYRVVHRQDAIAQLPPKEFLGYLHHKSEVWYNNNMAVGLNYTVCNEAESNDCSDGNTANLSWDDHNYYFNTSVLYLKGGC
uniref:Fungal lipase-like domain-containing protein n=1 Tax=Acrobeloides nanus TaxID=290746 RepID=A0A914ENU3_9BILA